MRSKEKPTPVLYLDLDGTVRKGKDELGKFVNGPKDVEVFEGVPKLMLKYKEAGYRIIAISNQGGISLGYISMEICKQAMLETQRQCNHLFDRIAFCYHHPNAKDPEDAVCWCRKPTIGLIVKSAIQLAMDTEYTEYYPPHMALFVGDRPEDKECAKRTSIKFIDAKEWRKNGEKYIQYYK